MLKPPVPYFGGKTILASQIAALLPAHRHYVEPYCGSLAVLLAKPPSPMETVNDLDEALITFWRVLREQPVDLCRVAALTPHSRAEHIASYDVDARAVDDLEMARRIWVMLTQGRGMSRARTGWRHYIKPAGKTSMPAYLDAYLDRMLPVAERLRGVSLECRPALNLIQRYGVEPDVLLYVDPPYLGSTRSERDGYLHEMRSDPEHRELAEALQAARAAVVLSGYASDLYDLELYPNWHRHTMTSGTGQGDGWGTRTEVLWSNRPFDSPAPLFELNGQVASC